MYREEEITMRMPRVGDVYYSIDCNTYIRITKVSDNKLICYYSLFEEGSIIPIIENESVTVSAILTWGTLKTKKIKY